MARRNLYAQKRTECNTGSYFSDFCADMSLFGKTHGCSTDKSIFSLADFEYKLFTRFFNMLCFDHAGQPVYLSSDSWLDMRALLEIMELCSK